MIYMDLTMIHAVPSGVFSKNPQREIFTFKNDVKVLRLKNSIDKQKYKDICTFARSLVGSIFSKREIIEALKTNNPTKKAKTKKQFCSRLVAQAYNSVGINIVDNPDYCSPQNIYESASLQEVNNTVRIAFQKHKKFAKKYDPNLKNQEITFNWLKTYN